MKIQSTQQVIQRYSKTDISKNDKEFKEEIGAFVIAFSELEFGIAFLCAMTEFDLRKKDEYIHKYLGFTFERKLQHLTSFISENLNELEPIWSKIKVEIGQINRERRFLVHGFMKYHLPIETITTHIKEKSNITTKKQSIEEIRELVNRLDNLKTGENGINGSFLILFTKTRIDKWNDLVSNDNKIVYKVNNEILSNWKGK